MDRLLKEIAATVKPGEEIQLSEAGRKAVLIVTGLEVGRVPEEIPAISLIPAPAEIVGAVENVPRQSCPAENASQRPPDFPKEPCQTRMLMEQFDREEIATYEDRDTNRRGFAGIS